MIINLNLFNEIFTINTYRGALKKSLNKINIEKHFKESFKISFYTLKIIII